MIFETKREGKEQNSQSVKLLVRKVSKTGKG